ncbi:YggS family pyridoxal phosphate-dependent enzyme [Pacificimonas flava]|uniref:Pyridoxal phosphate homeostasis protein n=1 Tax=Pacificimonas flava TaxID=1234595 RepID=M2TQF2_9SPHN|nr:YggS family pyridoxal phosphate-dependent enzyme [Pacificimonas flava]EMD83996.1 hypothetical protein C725_0968 [Pacificimonas flava]MBB5281031.1 hypothetical protein [Pacificimonas flava]
MTQANDRLTDVRQRIARMAKVAGRDPADITLIAVSKTQPAEDIRPLLEAGHRDFGENRVQEAEQKWPALKAEFPDVRLHMIGQLQSNKAAAAAALFDALHSVDRPSLVRALGKIDMPPPVFLQVDVGEEAQKGGCPPADLPALRDLAADCRLNVRGLMCLPPAKREAAPYFALLARLAKDAGLEGLSMGMSGDFETAVQLGATHVRVGTALFGPRP